MLLELRIENLLVIERAELRLGEGLNVITGETGAGKTILAHSLDLLMGGKARSGIVRPGAEEAYVEGVFSLPKGLFEDPELAEVAERLPDDPGEIVLGRRVGASGRTAAFIQGRSASAADLRTLGQRLLAFYGQHEHRKLTLASAQLEVLDGFAGAEHVRRRRRHAGVHVECLALERELEGLRERDGARERDLDLLSYELSEIEAAAPDANEEEALAEERQRLRHAEGLRAAAATALASISGGEDGEGGAVAILGEAAASLGGPAGVDPELDGIAARAGGLGVELSDLAAELRTYVDGIQAEPGRLEEVESRLEILDRLKRKHGGSIEAVLEHAARCRTEIERLEGGEERAAEVEAKLADAQGRRGKLADALSKRRSEVARELEKRVAKELRELAMEGAKLEVRLEPHQDGHGANGRERVEFRVATNPGLPVSPLREAASGGELSRLMLALSGLGSETAPRTLAFDEIDSGIGGNTARTVGERLRGVGETRQVLCITHLPQIASLASRHFRIAKSIAGGRAVATVERVDGEELVAEICRMLGADREDEAASRHARELLAA